MAGLEELVLVAAKDRDRRLARRSGRQGLLESWSW